MQNHPRSAYAFFFFEKWQQIIGIRWETDVKHTVMENCFWIFESSSLSLFVKCCCKYSNKFTFHVKLMDNKWTAFTAFGLLVIMSSSSEWKNFQSKKKNLGTSDRFGSKEKARPCHLVCILKSKVYLLHNDQLNLFPWPHIHQTVHHLLVWESLECFLFPYWRVDVVSADRRPAMLHVRLTQGNKLEMSPGYCS